MPPPPPPQQQQERLWLRVAWCVGGVRGEPTRDAASSCDTYTHNICIYVWSWVGGWVDGRVDAKHEKRSECVV